MVLESPGAEQVIVTSSPIAGHNVLAIEVILNLEQPSSFNPVIDANAAKFESTIKKKS